VSTPAIRASLQTKALAYIACWLTEDYWTIARIVEGLKESGASAEQVAESFSLAAASLLTDVFGGMPSEAATWAENKALKDACREARRALKLTP
jgi:hypothetical protein